MNSHGHLTTDFNGNLMEVKSAKISDQATVQSRLDQNHRQMMKERKMRLAQLRRITSGPLNVKRTAEDGPEITFTKDKSKVDDHQLSEIPPSIYISNHPKGVSLHHLDDSHKVSYMRNNDSESLLVGVSSPLPLQSDSI